MLPRFSDLRVQNKILIVLLVAGAGALLSLVFTTSRMQHVRGIYADLTSSQYPARLEAARFTRAMLETFHAAYAAISFDGAAKEAGEAAAEARDAMRRALAHIDGSMSLDPQRAEAFRPLRARFEAMRPKIDGAIEKGLADDARQFDLIRKLEPEFQAITHDALRINNAFIDDLKADAHRASGHVDEAVTVAYALGLASIAGCLGFGVAVGRFGIARPLTRLNGRMTSLAEGDVAAEVPHRERRDEIGRMARSVQVFKDGAIEKLRLEGESQEQRRAAEAERAAAEREREAARAAQEAVVSALAGALARLAEGDLACRIGQAFPAEYEGLRR
ncbi:MAG: HAMP domain-containing protein, partial [Methylobacteriaceae bacterium]|nr:HAMP domain-containing protein [Methylobacteriaceae bacterium]